jgi:hypothetical protein
MTGIDRRYLDRFVVPDAEVEYSCDEGGKEKGSLADITKISVRFEVKQQFNPGDLINLEIVVPDKDRISVRGHVVRTIHPIEARSSYVAVQFLPFGSDQRYNSMKSYDQLDALTCEYTQKVA